MHSRAHDAERDQECMPMWGSVEYCSKAYPSRLRNKWQDMDGLGKAKALGQEAPKCEESVAVLGHLIEN